MNEELKCDDIKIIVFSHSSNFLIFSISCWYCACFASSS